MSQQLTINQPTPKTSALAAMASRLTIEPKALLSTLKNTVFKGASDDEMAALVIVSNTYDLNPLLKEIYAFPKKGGGIVPMVPIDGWIKIANRQPNYDGMDVQVYGDGKTPTHATCEIFVKGRSRSVRITEYYDECKRGTDPWNQMPRRMLRNKAISQAVRVAFGVSGIFDDDEAADVVMRDATPRTKTGSEVIDPFEKSEALGASTSESPGAQEQSAESEASNQTESLI